MHRDELGLGPVAEVVNGAGHQFLAGSALALDEHRGAGGRDLLNGLQNRAQAVVAAQNALHAELLLNLLAQAVIFLLEAAAAQGAFDEQLHLIKVQRLGDKMIGAAAHGLHGGFHAAVGGHHDADRRLGQGHGLLQEFHAIIAAEAQIGEHHINAVVAKMLQGLRGIGGHKAVELVLQRLTQPLAGVAFVVEDEQGG